MEQVKNKQSLIVPTIFFAGLASVGLIVGALLWGLLESPEFFICFIISFCFSIPMYFLINTTKYLIDTDSKKKNLGIIGIVVRYLCAILSVVSCFLYIYFTSQKYAYLFIAPTVILIVYFFVILRNIKEGK